MQCATQPTGLWGITPPPPPPGADTLTAADSRPPPGDGAVWAAWLEQATRYGRWGTLPPPPARRARRPRSRAGRGFRASVLSTALLAAGLLFGLDGLGMLVYVPWREQAYLAQRPAGPQEDLPARWEAPTVDGADRGARVAATKTLGEGPEWMSIPRIGVDPPVMEMGLQRGEYQVPSFDVGHHADSANPGQSGNSIYNGHLQTIDAGQVFARLHELRPGDLVYVYTASYRFDWVVEEAHTVRNDDRGVLQPTSEPRLTLYTCAGSFDVRTHDYTHRLVVVGRLAQVVPRAHPPGTQS